MKLLLSSLALSAVATIFTSCAGMAGSSASSASISSISASISAATMPGNAFQDDIRIATAAAVESGATGRDVLRSVTMVANQHGMTDWESQPAAYYAIGEGLRLAGSDESAVLALAPQIAGDDEEAASSILAGFRAYHA